MSIPERVVNPTIQMFVEALGTAPGRNRMQGRHVLVVGAGQRAVAGAEGIVGNGRAIAILAAREGGRVVCADINAESARETVEMITAEGGSAFGRQGTGWEVAYATIFLLSNEASYINAQSLFVDGGLGTGIAM